MFLFKRRAFGLDISDSAIYVLELTGKKNKFRIKSFARGSLAPGIIEDGLVKNKKALSEAIKKLLKEAKPKAIKTKRVIISLPESRVFSYIFSFPKELKRKQIAEALEYETKEIIPLAKEKSFADFQVIREGKETKDIFYAAVSREVVNNYKEVLEKSGLKPVIFDMESASLARSLIEKQKNDKEEGATLILDIGGRTTIISIFDKNGIQMTYNVPVAGDYFTKEIANKLKISSEKAEQLKKTSGFNPEKNGGEVFLILQSAIQPLLEEVEKSIKYYEHKNKRPIRRIILAGGSSKLPKLADYIVPNVSSVDTNKTREVFVGDPSIFFDKNFLAKQKVFKTHLIDYATVIGLAMRAFFSKREGGINFLPKVGILKRIILKVFKNKKKEEVTEIKFSWGGIKKFIIKHKSIILISLSIFLIVVGSVMVVNYLFRGSGGRQPGKVEISRSPQKFLFKTTVKDISKGKINKDDIPGRIISVAYEKTGTFFPSNTQSVEGKSKGKVTLINKTSSGQRLVATTRLLSPEGILFRLKNGVTVPAKGRIEAEVYADKEGKTGDIEPTTFTIPGLSVNLQKVIYAESSKPMKGGVLEIGVITKADIDNAREELISTAVEESLAKVEAKVEFGDQILEDLASVNVSEVVFDKKAGESVSEFKVTINANVEVLVFNNNDVLDEAQVILADQLATEDAAANYNIVIKEIKVNSYDQSLGSAALEISALAEPK